MFTIIEGHVISKPELQNLNAVIKKKSTVLIIHSFTVNK